MIKDFDELVKDNYQNETIEYNFHSHNYLCGHAFGTVSDYVSEAIKQGLKVIGISDHGHVKIQNYNSYIGLEEIDSKYLPQFDEAIKKYGKDITIKKGLEIEYVYDNDDYYQKLLSRLDYLILGMHHYLYNGELKMVFSGAKTVDQAICYYNTMIDGIKSGYFKILAHPDVMVGSYYGNCPKAVLDKLEEAVTEAIKNNVLIEINVNGYRSNGRVYPTDELLDLLVKYNAKTVIGSDNHLPGVLVDDCTKKMVKLAKIKGINIAKLNEIQI